MMCIINGFLRNKQRSYRSSWNIADSFLMKSMSMVPRCQPNMSCSARCSSNWEWFASPCYVLPWETEPQQLLMYLLMKNPQSRSIPSKAKGEEVVIRGCLFLLHYRKSWTLEMQTKQRTTGRCWSFWRAKVALTRSFFMRLESLIKCFHRACAFC